MDEKRVVRWFTSELYGAVHPIEFDQWALPFLRRMLAPNEWDKIKLEYGQAGEEVLLDLRGRLTDQRLRDATADEIEQWFRGGHKDEAKVPSKKLCAVYAKDGQFLGQEIEAPRKPLENVEQDPAAQRPLK